MSIHLDADHPAIRAALSQAPQDDTRRAVLASAAQKGAKQYKTGKRGSGPEQGIQNAILDYLHARGILAWRINSGAIKAAHGGLVKLAPKGHSDIFLLLPGGRAGFIEVKAPKGKLSEDQRAFLARVQQAGALAFVARSIEDVERALHDVVSHEDARNA